MKKKLLIALLAIAAAICCAFGFAACGESDNGTYYLFVEDQYVMSEYVTIDGKNWSDSNGMSGKVEIKDGTAYFYMDFFGQETIWQQGKIGGGKLELQGLSGPMTYYKEGKAHIHSFSDWQVTKEPTCTAAGQKMRVCSCGEKEQQSIPSLGHDIVSKEVTVPATCSSEGHLTNTCSRCGTFDEALPINPSSHYIDKGKDTSVCSGCGIKLADSLEFNEGSTSVSLTGGEGVNVIVPIMYAGKPVTDIGERAFSECTSLESVTIPESVTSIGDLAFYNCENLESITVDSDNKNYSSHDGILYNKNRTLLIQCPATKSSVTIPNGVTSIGERAFAYCTSLTSITIPDSVTSIGYEAFYNCTNVKVATIPALAIYYIPQDSLQTVVITSGDIGNYAFDECKSLESVTIGDGVTSIGNYAFYNCTSLENIIIGNGVTSIGSGAFNGCTSLENITIGNEVTSIGERAFYDCTSLASITISDSVTSIGYSAFQYCESLTGVNITDLAAWCNIEFGSIDANPLYYAHSLNLNDEPVAEITAEMLQGVTQIKDYAFYNCTNLESITISDSVTSIGDYVFYNCASLGSVTFGNNSKLETIGSSAFYGCTSLESITIPDSVTSIGSGAFNGCTSLANVTIGNNVISIGQYAFYGCTSLENISVSEGNPTYSSQDGILYNKAKTEFVHIPKAIKNVTIPDSVTSIGNSAFYDCANLESVTISDSVTSIGELAFAGCTSLASVTFGNNSKLETIGSSAFSGCTSLVSITIPASVTSIGKRAFSSCTSLESVNVGNNSKLETIGEYAFDYCTSLTEVYITDLKAWCNIEFGSFNANPLYYAHNLNLNDELLTKITADMLQGVTSIPAYAFSCDSLESISIPDSVTSISNYAFYECTNIKAATIPALAINSIPQDSLQTVVITSGEAIGNRAFYECDSLESVTIGNGVTFIGNYAFENCTSLTSINIPDSVISIGIGAFTGCSKLKQTQDGVQYVDKWVVGCNYSSTTASLRADTKGIACLAFGSYTKLESITIPDSVTSIGERAFSGCENLKNVTFENTTGWKVSESSSMSNAQDITVTNDAAQNTTLLRDTYLNYFWHRYDN